MVNTDTQPIITGEMGAMISVVSDTAYNVTVIAVVGDSQRSEPDRERVTAGGCSRIDENIPNVLKFREDCVNMGTCFMCVVYRYLILG